MDARDARIRELEAENARLRAEVAELKAKVEKLTAALEAALRAGKRQAAPFRKADGPAVDPKKPGRKKGRGYGFHAHRTAPARDKIDESYHAPLPDCCPKCGGRHVEETRTAKQYQTEIPRRPIHREFTIHVGECRDCGHRLSGDELAEAGLGLARRLEQLASGRFTYTPNRRLAKHVLGHAMNWFWFLIDPTIDATNWRAEQAIRPAVVNRKVWGGNRTGPGAHAQGVLTSLLVTLEQRGYEALAWLSAARCAIIPLPLPP
jgi:hypothetical protein